MNIEEPYAAYATSVSMYGSWLREGRCVASEVIGIKGAATDECTFISCALYALHDSSPVHDVFICWPKVKKFFAWVALIRLELSHEPLGCAARGACHDVQCCRL